MYLARTRARGGARRPAEVFADVCRREKRRYLAAVAGLAWLALPGVPIDIVGTPLSSSA